MPTKTITPAAKNIPTKIAALSDLLKKNQTALNSKTVTAGFDGFVDTNIKIIKTKSEKQQQEFFNKIGELGNYILQKKAGSFSLEFEEMGVKTGGNMPIMSNAMGVLGLNVNCVGAFGYPLIHPAFNTFSPNCSIQSFADPGTATAIELNDGKIILAQMAALNKKGWNSIKKIIGIQKLVQMFQQSQLLCMVNWSEIDTSTSIWKGVLKDVLPAYDTAQRNQTAFFDLSDCSKRSNASIKEALSLIQKFSRHAKVVLGLNQNEASLVYKALHQKSSNKDLLYKGSKIFDSLGIETLVVHSSKEATGFTKDGCISAKGFHISNPKISTGAGDNFNAGFCTAHLLNLGMDHCLIFAHAVAALYVQKGSSPQLKELIRFLKNNHH